ncbi:DUF4394 domain-containing protein [Streptomyces sp. BH-SS-21]|uniref:DUF4394 domain-containing protein n=1 Tax=Streptomyces liliiviolaceus TaxID=2823109 RepID=A0A940XPC9_9ACTN|nr:DUF4394 domain-containing protein [Streptomyces liliiviolaceus]MBQ0847967.1 DUF4394 domain-containing protein [Streptomyces liliiviolaceus]
MKAAVKKRIAAAVAVVCAATALTLSAPGSSSAAPDATPSLRAYGLAGDGTLLSTFWTDNPKVLNWVLVIDGLVGDTKIIGIDFRVQNGLLYGVGDKGGIYTIKMPPALPDTVVATKVSQLAVSLYGTVFDIDFNPAADRLRVISNYGQNLRHNLNDGTTVADSALTVPPLTTAAQGVTAAGYTNNDLVGSTATTLFDIDTYNDQVVIQSPPNAGTLVPTGLLGFDAGVDAGLDIYSTLTNGKTTSNDAFASLLPYGSTRAFFYSVNVLTGEPTSIGQFPLNVTDIAISLTGT